jgi:hypothetical protein
MYGDAGHAHHGDLGERTVAFLVEEHRERSSV